MVRLLRDYNDKLKQVDERVFQGLLRPPPAVTELVVLVPAGGVETVDLVADEVSRGAVVYVPRRAVSQTRWLEVADRLRPFEVARGEVYAIASPGSFDLGSNVCRFHGNSDLVVAVRGVGSVREDEGCADIVIRRSSAAPSPGFSLHGDCGAWAIDVRGGRRILGEGICMQRGACVHAIRLSVSLTPR